MPDFTVTTNFKVKQRQIRNYAGQLSRVHLLEATRVALDEVGFTAVQKFMKPTTLSQAISDKPTDVLSVRSGRLAGSIVGNFAFSKTSLPSSVEKHRSGNYNSSSSDFSGGKKESIREAKITAGGIQGIIGSKVEYAARHEFGFPKGKTPARPYLRPAVKVSMRNIQEIYRETVVATFKNAKI